VPRAARAAEPAGQAPPLIETTTEAGDADAEEPRRRLVKWNEYDWPVSTFRFGGGILLDGAAYSQDDASQAQIAMEPDAGVRDFRLLFKGRFKTERPFSWTLGYMYDGADKEWRFRQTGVQIGIPEWHGSLFVGRTKEGYSMVKVMVGYHGWTMERSPALDAFVPILADGLKWSGYYPTSRVFYQIGVYSDHLAEDEKFATSDHQVVTRVGWQPILSESGDRLLHVAVMARDSDPDNGSAQIRSRPEAYLAPYFLDTGKFAADRSHTLGFETSYRSGPWLFGAEYDWQGVDASDGRTPLFHAGDAVAAWLITGEIRPYNAAGAYFTGVSPKRTVFAGGPGAWEAVFHLSYSDFDSEGFQGGKFWRFTPMANWHLSDNLRLEMGYGYGVLDRFGLEGHTQFFQFRIQATL
jgi:phosphate-selective porin OprO/OprP